MADQELIDMMSSKPSYCRTMAESMVSAMVGGIVTSVFITPGGDENYLPEGYGFTIKSADGISRNVYVLMDPEGNGPGHLEIRDELACDRPTDEQINKGSIEDGRKYAHDLHSRQNLQMDELQEHVDLMPDCKFKQGYLMALETIGILIKRGLNVSSSPSEWHCNCSDGYIHHVSTLQCNVCGCYAPEPDNGDSDEI